MSDATFSQAHRLSELIAREQDRHAFLQNLHGNWGLVQKIGRGEVSQATFVAGRNPHVKGRVEPTFFHPEGYKPNSVEEQVHALCQRLGDLDTRYVPELAKGWDLTLYQQADGLYVEPKPTTVARLLKIERPFAEGWGTLTEQGPLASLAATRPFRNWMEGKLTPEQFRISRAAAEALIYLEYVQQGDFLVYPAQLGRLYAGHSVEDSRWGIRHIEGPWQWPETGYGVGWMLYTNHHRLTRFKDLAVDCPGDEYRTGASGEFDCCPRFHWYGGELRFDTHRISGVYGSFGSASAFR